MNQFVRNNVDQNTIARKHAWVTVVNPVNQRLLLQACDDCGVVKSENSIIRSCKAEKGLALISRSSGGTLRVVA